MATFSITRPRIRQYYEIILWVCPFCVTVRNPPAICLNVPYLKKVGKLCVQLYNMNVGKNGLSGCARISLKVAFVKVVKVNLGCFKTRFAEDEVLEVTAYSQKEVALREMKLLGAFFMHYFGEEQYT